MGRVASWIDLSVPVRNGMVHWPSDPPFHLERVAEFAKGDCMTLSRMSLSVHTGTHMDAPLHFVGDGAGMDEMPLDATVGEARVIEIRDQESVKRGDLEQAGIRAGERILLKTRNSETAWRTDVFEKDFIYISLEAAEFLAAARIKSVGVDYLSVGGFYKDGPEIHRALLGAGIWVIEGLDLSSLRAGAYELICLPMKLAGADGAPARAIARPL